MRWHCDDLCHRLSFSPHFLTSIRFNWDQSLGSSSIVWDYSASGINLLQLSVDIQAKDSLLCAPVMVYSPIINFRRENGTRGDISADLDIRVWMKKKLNHRQTVADCRISFALHMDCLPAWQPKPAHMWLVSSTRTTTWLQMETPPIPESCTSAFINW